MTCHIGVIQGKGEVPERRCSSCHLLAGHIERYNDKEFIHAQHVSQNKEECFECHQTIKYGLKLMAPTITLDCQQCYQQQHAVSEEMYMGIGGKGVQSIPSAMFKTKVDCNGCHRYERKEKIGSVVKSIKLAKPDACDLCHDEGTGEMLVPAWQESTKDTYKEVQAKFDAIKTKMKQASALNERTSKKIKKLLSQAEHNLKFIKADGSWGVHNLEYADTLMSKADEYLNQIDKLILKK